MTIMKVKIGHRFDRRSAPYHELDGERQGRHRLANGLALAALTTLAGCAVGPDYVEPAPPPAAFHGADDDLFAERPFEVEWWAQFGDPVLDNLVERALRADLDVRVAALRIEESRALLRTARRRQWPSSQLEVARDESKAQQPVFTNE